METLFDHSPTQAELKTLLPTVLSKEEYLSLPMDLDSELGRIYRLYMLRGQETTAKTFLDRIQDEAYRFNVAQVDTIRP